ncbi:MAG: DegT/DnrJ/EryC1/StrS family aminotransferase [bacterium]|jgi:dTDP-4-amino-4,6-dideoxygalactose transaminase
MPEMNIPLLDLQPQLDEMRDELVTAVTEVIDSKRYIMGPEVEALEKEIAEYCGVAEAVGVSSGTDALLLALMALDIGPGDLVLTTNFSFFATAGVISRLNATPVFVDIDPITFNMDPEQVRVTLQRMSAEERSRIKALLPVHLYGQCADMDELMSIAEELGVPVVEDAAQAIGSECLFRGERRRAGSVGVAGCFSFFPSKNLGGLGDGGIITVNDPELAYKIRIKRVHGAEERYFHRVIGGNFRLDPIQAVVVRLKLKRLDSWHQQRQQNAARYFRMFEETGLNDFIRLPEAVHDRSLSNRHIYNQFMARALRRDELKAFLQQEGVASEVYYPLPFHKQECFADLGYAKEAFPVSNTAAETLLSLPVYPGVTEEAQRYVTRKVAEFYGV